jgi:hypothetical protein
MTSEERLRRRYRPRRVRVLLVGESPPASGRHAAQKFLASCQFHVRGDEFRRHPYDSGAAREVDSVPNGFVRMRCRLRGRRGARPGTPARLRSLYSFGNVDDRNFRQETLRLSIEESFADDVRERMMTAMETGAMADLQSVLVAPRRSQDIPESDDLYGWLIGSWELDVIHYASEVPALPLKGEAHFQWTLEGRAVQDVWIMPRRSDRTAHLTKTNNIYGTTLRVWESTLKAWRVTWINPVTGHRSELVGRRSGNDIVQIGTQADGMPIRWTFTEITSVSFLWTGELLNTDGQTWRLQSQFRARRI